MFRPERIQRLNEQFDNIVYLEQQREKTVGEKLDDTLMTLLMVIAMFGAALVVMYIWPEAI